MESIYFKELFEYSITEFEKHLINPFNERIIFSGKYGTGKTQFLLDFFNHVKSNKETTVHYNVYRLFPTNYSIASNEDIIRYIKYDIIIEMLKQSITFEEIELDIEQTLPTYISENLFEIVKSLVYMIPKVGKEVEDILEKNIKLKEEFLKYHKSINNSDSDKILNYLERIESQEGSVYENDITTKIISKGISNKENKSVLIIDDIDRLDPDHVFRILNVFASHFESNSVSGKRNKFDFDKIIIVCDFNNLRNIFHHRYGKQADFMGYIDKFYSTEVFNFDNKTAITKIVYRIIDSYNIVVTSDEHYLLSIYKDFYLENNFLENMLSFFILSNKLSLRNLMKSYGKNLFYHDEKWFFGRTSNIKAWQVPIILQLKILKDIFGEFNSFFSAIKQLGQVSFQVKNFDEYIGDFIFLLSTANHNFNPNAPYLFIYNKQTMVVDAKLNIDNGQLESVSIYYQMGIIAESGQPVKGSLLPLSKELFEVSFLDTIKNLNTIGILK